MLGGLILPDSIKTIIIAQTGKDLYEAHKEVIDDAIKKAIFGGVISLGKIVATEGKKVAKQKLDEKISSVVSDTLNQIGVLSIDESKK